MTTIRIEITNTTSTITISDKSLFDQLRHLVSYQAEDLPPRDVQRILKRWYGRIMADGQQRWGYENDLGRVYRTHEGQELRLLGWEQDRWTRSLFEATLRNPGIWDGWKPLITSGGEFATGLISHVKRTLTLHLGQDPARIICIDSRTAPRLHTSALSCPVNPLPLWPHQQAVVEMWAACGYRGVWDLPPRSGKTRASAQGIASLGVPTLVVVPRVGLVTQAAEVYRTVFGPQQVVELHGSAGSKAKQHKASIRAPLWVATPRTAAGLDLSTRHLLVIDEYHHAAANTYQEISNKARNAYYRLGLTGTHYRADAQELIMHGVVGPACYKATVGDMVARGVLAPGRVAMLRGAGAGKVSQNDDRNALVAWATQHLIAQGKRVLVLTVEVAHTHGLAAAIPGAVPVDGRKNKEVPDILASLMRGDIRCVVGTSVIGEGVDVPAADALVYVCGSRSRVKVTQDVYRVLTASPGKAHGVIVDFADEADELGIQRAADRLYEYRRNGFDVSVINPTEFMGWLARA